MVHEGRTIFAPVSGRRPTGGQDVLHSSIRMAFHALNLTLVSMLLWGCEKPVIEAPISPQEKEISVARSTPSPSALIADTSSPELSTKSQTLIVEYEVGGVAQYNRNPYPEAPDARYSGVTFGVGYDAHQNAPHIIQVDWIILGGNKPKRLSDTHPFYGKSAQQHLKDVQDILVPWTAAFEVFSRVDIARTYSQCQRTFPGFNDIRDNAKGALVSLVFNRGNSTTGPNRSEVRDIRDYGVPNKDYPRIASDLRKMERIWSGTAIERGMTRRREAEARLVETP